MASGDTGSLDPGMRGWIMKTAKRNVWRMPHWIELEDLVSEGYLCYAKCKQRYVGVEQRKLMALVKTTFCNRITDLAKARTRLNEIPVSALFTESEGESFFETRLGATDGLHRLAELVRDAPEELRAVLALLVTDAGRLALLKPHNRGETGRRETTNEKLCRLLGRDPSKVDLPTAIRDYLTAV